MRIDVDYIQSDANVVIVEDGVVSLHRMCEKELAELASKTIIALEKIIKWREENDRDDSPSS